MSTRGYENFSAADVARMNAKAAKPSKYRNKKTTIDGVTFDSAKEARRYSELKALEKSGEIFALVCQMRYPLIVGEQFIATYVADFMYHTTADGKMVVEDVKGMKTPVYRIKKKLVEALYGFRIQEM